MTHQTRLMGETVVDALRTASTTYRKLYYRPTTGNAGDALINVGFYSICDAIGISFEEVGNDFDYGSIRENELLILSGGGYIVPYWDGGSELIHQVTQFDFPLLMLPQSIQGREDVLRRLRPQDTLFLREKYSFEYARSLGLECALGVDHDLAFAVDADAVLKETPALPPNRRLRDCRKLGYCKYHEFRSTFISALDAFRTDIESARPGKKSRINDASLVAKFGTATRAENFYSAKRLLSMLSRYRRVRTDRLHVMIGCVLVNTPVTVFDNAYHKIRGVHEYSIAPFPDRSRLVSLSRQT